jgi:hypothetical protein
MNKTTKQILEEARALRLSFKKPDFVAFPEPLVQPPKALPWIYMHYQVLSNPDYSWCDIVINLFTTDGPVGDYESVHNHTRDERCYTKHRCYVLGYNSELRPEGGPNED